MITAVAWLTVAALVPPGHATAPPAAGDMVTKRVVILNSTDPYLPAFVVLDRAVREAILAGRGALTVFHAETLDMYRFPQARIDDDVFALLRKKYDGLKVDVIVAAGEIALAFAAKHRDAIWPGAAIVFHSASEASVRAAGAGPDTTGVPVRVDYGATLDLALALRPATRQVAVVAGTATPDQANLALARAALDARATRLDARYIVGRTLAETVAAVQALSPEAVVLYLTVFRDGAGAPLVPRDVLTRIAAASPVPVFGVFETYVDNGIAAGVITPYAADGRRAGELVVRVLDGEDPAAIGPQPPLASSCIADWRQLRRWNLRESLLPDGCDVRFRDTTVWDRHRWEILAALTIVLAQAALIAALWLSRRRLGRAQGVARAELQRRTAAEGVADRLRERLTRFGKERSLGAMATAISHEINQPLIAIQNYAQAAKRRLESSDDDRSRLVELLAKIEAQAQRAGAITQRVRGLVGTSDASLAPTRLAPLVDEVVGLMAPEAESRGCRVAYEPAGAPPAVVADPLQVQVVLVNLVRNAVESACASGSRDGRVLIDARPIDDGQVQVSVTDFGHGVAPELVADLFEPLASGTRGGMGMGLSIARAIVEAHGGRLWHEPNPAGGAVFRFTLRAAPP